MSVEELPIVADVSRETVEKLRAYRDLLLKWSKAINLIAEPDLTNIWDRHIMDGVQLRPFLDLSAKNWLDMGSGGGLPGIVLAIMAPETHPELQLNLVESDQRKCEFLRMVCRELGLSATVENERLEKLTPRVYDRISARALAPLPKLLTYAKPLMGPDTRLVFLKGRNYKAEIQEAARHWTLTCEELPSATDPEGIILVITDLEKKS